MNLKVLQESFIQQLTHSQESEDFLSYLKPCGNLTEDQQLAIYQNNVRGALQSSLAQVYPVCFNILGENYFRQLATVYIKQYPSRQCDLNLYGEFFSEYLAIQSQQRAELIGFPYLGDLAKLEWLYQLVYFAKDETVFDFSAFAQLTERQQAQSYFQLIPALKFICSDFPIQSIWQANQGTLDASRVIESKPEKMCILRKSNQLEVLTVDEKMYQLLRLIDEQRTLDELSILGCSDDMTQLIKQGWVDRFAVKHV